MKKTTIFIVMALLCLNFLARGQSAIILYGVINDENGKPVANASIQLVNSKQTVLSSKDGTFSLKITDIKGTLRISHIGFQSTQIDFVESTKTNLTIVLKQNENILNEVRIIGYGETTRKLSTGTSGSINAKDIEKQPVSNILSSLSGRISGVNVQTSNGLPGGGVNIKIRGKGALLAGTDPLYIIDGIPYNTTIGTLNNSVNPLAINSVNGSTSPFNSLNPDDIENITILKDADATSIYGSRGSNGVVLISTKKGKSGKTKYTLNYSQAINKTANLTKLMNLEDYLTMRKEAYKNDGTIPSTDPQSTTYAPDLLIWSQEEGEDWGDYLFGGTGHASVFQASANGGSEHTRFLISGNFRTEGTVLKGTNRYTRGGFLATINHKSSNQKFRIQFSNALTLDDNRLANASSMSTTLFLPPNYPLYDQNGDFNWTFSNPLAKQNAYSIAKTTNLNSNLSLDYEIIQGLRVKTSAGLSKIVLKQTQVFPSSSFAPGSINYTNFGNNSNSSFIVEPQINYHKSFGKFSLNALIGGTYQSTSSNGEYTKAENFSSESLMENIGSAGTVTASNNYTDYHYLSGFARATIDYQQKYIFNATLRRDCSSRFGEGKRFGNFGSIAAAWVFSEEKFLLNSSEWLSLGKIRASYGTTGNDQIAPYQYLSTYGSSPYTYQGVSGLRPTRIANDDFRWETTRKMEFAVELGFLANRILLNANYYFSKSDDQLVSYKLPYQTGFASYQANLPARVVNRGIELELSSKNIEKENFSWQTSFNLTIPKNRLQSFENFSSSSYAQTLELGYDITRIYGYQYLGIDPQTGAGRYADNTGTASNVPFYFNTIGKQTPELFGGLGNTINYKKFSLDLFLQFSKQHSLGGLQYSPGIRINNFSIVDDRWKNPGDQSIYPKASNIQDNNFVYSSANYFNSSYLRVKNINFSYEIAGHLLKAVSIEKLRVYAQAQNLFTIWNRDIPLLDPESGSYSSANPNFPPMKTLLIGLQMQF